MIEAIKQTRQIGSYIALYINEYLCMQHNVYFVKVVASQRTVQSFIHNETKLKPK